MPYSPTAVFFDQVTIACVSLLLWLAKSLRETRGPKKISCAKHAQFTQLHTHAQAIVILIGKTCQKWLLMASLYCICYIQVLETLQMNNLSFKNVHYRIFQKAIDRKISTFKDLIGNLKIPGFFRACNRSFQNSRTFKEIRTQWESIIA